MGGQKDANEQVSRLLSVFMTCSKSLSSLVRRLWWWWWAITDLVFERLLSASRSQINNTIRENISREMFRNLWSAKINSCELFQSRSSAKINSRETFLNRCPQKFNTIRYIAFHFLLRSKNYRASDIKVYTKQINHGAY